MPNQIQQGGMTETGKIDFLCVYRAIMDSVGALSRAIFSATRLKNQKVISAHELLISASAESFDIIKDQKLLNSIPGKDYQTIKDKRCASPSLFPGDIVSSKKSGAVFAIEQAQVPINGLCIKWCDSLPKNIEHGSRPSYAAQYLSGREGERYAWWDIDEFNVLELGPLHKYKEGVLAALEGK